MNNVIWRKVKIMFERKSTPMSRVGFVCVCVYVSVRIFVVIIYTNHSI